MKDNIREFSDLDFLEGINKKFIGLSNIKLESFSNLFIYGKDGIGRTLRVRILLSKLFGSQGVFNFKYAKCLLGKKHDEFNYLRSMYHIEIDLKMNINLNDKVIYEDFLREYLETQNVIINKCKVIVIKSFELATEQLQKCISSMIEKNYLTSKFILIGNKRFDNLNLRSKTLEIRFGSIKKDDIIKYLREYSVEKGYIIYDKQYEDIVETCKKNDGYYNLKNIFALFEMATISRRYCGFYNSFNCFIDNILEKIMKKNFKFKGLAVLRSDLYDLYTSTVPVVETIKYIYKYLINKYNENKEFCFELTKGTNDTDLFLKMSNKDIIHLENYIVFILTLKNKFLI